MNKQAARVLLPLAVVVVGSLTACGGSSGSGSSGGGYVLGAALPLSGAGASTAATYRQGIEACVKWVNENDGLPKKITVKYVDTAGETEKGTAAFTKLTSVDRASMVFSAFSSITSALAPLAERAKVPVLNGGALSPALAGLDWVWNDIPFISQELGASIPYIKEKHPRFKKASLVYQNDLLGQEAVEIMKKGWTGEGRALATLPVAVNATSFTAQVDKVKAQAPDVIFMVYSGESQTALLQQLRSAGVDAQVVGASPIGELPSVLDLPEADGTLFTLQAMNFDSPDQITKFFLKEMNISAGEGAPAIPGNYCNGVLMWAHAAKELVREGKDVTGAALNEKFGAQGRIDAVGGSLELLADHTLKTDISINQIKDGKVTTLTTIPADG
ncbi:branched-chain amino acid ABC transporter substrate-binding protein [Sphaerisporangium rufum]|uniref:Branched-chain amino acid ABC transporter substrate-binding protein n=1 Tax=Sphaerisporangium rufum TaxID=1381558 RepID=A0A919R7E3_9ACTN|nr:ABC transporter substrate-binding protein [Sphaerisporangium rufum]GII81047.1 branched-chain amino acid ABC transporter substrate-binding protein [Sphaerisporangium rufum]